MTEEFSFEFAGEHNVISEGKNGWKLELNKISWNGRAPKYDIRSWSEDHKKMGKGITLTDDELKSLKNLLNQIELG